MSHRNLFILGSRGQRSRSRVTKHCRRGFLHSRKSWLLLIITLFCQYIRLHRMHCTDVAYCYRCRTQRDLCVCVSVLRTLVRCEKRLNQSRYHFYRLHEEAILGVDRPTENQSKYIRPCDAAFRQIFDRLLLGRCHTYCGLSACLFVCVLVIRMCPAKNG